MFTAVGLQVAATVLLGCLTWTIFGATAGTSLLLGGAAAFVPNGLFALRLALHRGKSPESYPAVFFLGEFAKIGLTVGLMALIIKSYEELSWLPLIVGMIVSLKMPLFALWMTGNRAPIGQLLAGTGATKPD